MIKKIGLLGVSLLALAAVQARAESWDMPMAYPASNYHSENGAKFATCVADATKGSLTITTHPGGSLFAGNDIKRAVQTGTVPIGERLISAHANENPLFGIDSIPFLATSYDASDKLWNAALPTLKEALEEQNLVYVYSVPWPPQGLYTKKDVNSAADLKGIKFRAYNAATASIASLAGMQPVQIEAADLSQALATGVVESFVSSGSTGVDSKAWESLTNFYDVQAWLPRDVVFINKDSYSALDDATKNAIMDCGAEASKNGETMAKDLTAQYLKTLADNGMKVSPPGDKLKSDLEGFGETMTKEWLEKAGAKGQSIIDAYKKAE
ncbi:TRAP-type C4-dicarboxylate transport system substrate-binding protein [Ciceribacter lividus]|uniref:TRAP-type C4-dicarboxylate transport system substrate-binding protein n=1 Tax=Ciceribacter lividus TaxID=1197950 RepID=A0A6I7HL23_9HYPH|nr:TRAP transporter substrate-binding protein [Ciceribacter lividus]RCW23975.1 TRAP-type C4-dicarboxylate transport system substrate-binding protein [Ciceribacter lividus]